MCDSHAIRGVVGALTVAGGPAEPDAAVTTRAGGPRSQTAPPPARGARHGRSQTTHINSRTINAADPVCQTLKRRSSTTQSPPQSQSNSTDTAKVTQHRHRP